MATYKVLQDIEAEDKLIGPLTLRQCIYAAIAVLAGYLSFLLISKGAGFLAIPMLPIIGFGLFFAWPWSKQQSTEVWALAKVRFALKPRKRIWDQSGVKDLVTVTAPKKIEDPRVHKMSETEVRSRLQALANTIDTRGWATKNIPLEMYMTPTIHPTSDRLVGGMTGPREVDEYKTADAEDMFDLANNPLAQQFETKMAAASTQHRQQLISQLAAPQANAPQVAAPQANSYWYGAQAPQAIPAAAGVPVAATPTPEEEALAHEVKRKHDLINGHEPARYDHLRTIQPLSAQPSQPTAISQAAPIAAAAATPVVPASVASVAAPVQNPAPAVTPPANPAILELANNNDLDIATIAREAHHRNPDGSTEVVVRLH